MVKSSVFLLLLVGSMSSVATAGPLLAVLGVVGEVGAEAGVAGGLEAGIGAAASAAARWVGAIGDVVGGASSAAETISSAISHHHSRSEPPVFITRRQAADAATLAKQNQLAIQECHGDLGKAKVQFSAPGPGAVLVKGMPATCMTLSTVLTGKFNEGNPVPMGSDSIQFTNLSEQSVHILMDALKAHH